MIRKQTQKYIKFDKRAFVIDLDAFKAVCTPSTKELGTREYEISQIYESADNGELNLSQKVEHETKSNGNPQNDMIVYDVVKMFIVSLLENDKIEAEFEYDFGTVFAINTLLSWGVLKEIKN